MSNRTFSLSAFLTGLVVGAGTIYFADKKNRQKARKILEAGLETLDEARENPKVLSKIAKKEVQKAQKVADQAYSMATKQTKKVKQEVKKLTAKASTSITKKTGAKKATAAAKK